jgi:hypothetical protein
MPRPACAPGSTEVSYIDKWDLLTTQKQRSLEMAAAGDDFEPVADGLLNSYRVGNLTPNTTYRVRVAAQSLHGSSPFSPSATFTTLPYTPVTPAEVRCIALLPAPRRSKKRNKARPCIHVEWTVGSGAPAGSMVALSFEVQATNKASSRGGRLSAASKARHVVLRGAEYNTTYVVRVRSVGPGNTGCSPWITGTPVTTPLCVKPAPSVSSRLAADTPHATFPPAETVPPLHLVATVPAPALATKLKTPGLPGCAPAASPHTPVASAVTCTPRSCKGGAARKAVTAVVACAPTAGMPAAARQRRARRGFHRQMLKYIGAGVLALACVVLVILKLQEAS